MDKLAIILDTVMFGTFSLLGQGCFWCAWFGDKEKEKGRLLYAIYFTVGAIMFRLMMMSD